MLRVKNCCCGLLPLKTGCLAIAVLGIVLGLVWAMNLSGATGGWTAAYVLGIVLEILVYVSLLVGVLLNKHQFIGLSLIGVLIIIIWRIIIFIVMVAMGILLPLWLAINIVFHVAVILLNVYFGIVINSYYRTLKGGSDPF